MVIVLEYLTVSHHNVCLQQGSSDNSVRVVNCVASKCEFTAGQK